MTCPDCGHPLVDGSYLCANAACPLMLKRCPSFVGGSVAPPTKNIMSGFYGADPAPVPTESFTMTHRGEPVEVARMRGTNATITSTAAMACSFCGEAMTTRTEGALTYVEHPGGDLCDQLEVLRVGATVLTYGRLKALVRVADAQSEMDRKRGVNQR